MTQKIKKYDIVYGQAAMMNDKSIQASCRYWVVVSNDFNNAHSPIIMVMPLTSKIKRMDLPTHAVIQNDLRNGLRVPSMVLGEQTTIVGKETMRRVGRIGDRPTQLTVFRCYLNASDYGGTDMEDLPYVAYA